MTLDVHNFSLSFLLQMIEVNKELRTNKSSQSQIADASWVTAEWNTYIEHPAFVGSR